MTQLGSVQQTLMIPLYGRAVETGKRRPLLRDPQAVRIVETIDYDFAQLKPFLRGARGAVMRTAIFDVWAQQFLADHPAGTVVEIGTGLNTRFERLDNGTVHWFDLDLPDVIELRRRFFTDTDRRRMLAASVLDPDWVEVVLASPGPYLFLAEAVLLYFEPDQVTQTLRLVATRFPGSRLALDTGGPAMAEAIERNKAMRTIGARMTWVCEDPTELERLGLGLRLLDSRTLAEPQPELWARTPLRFKILAAVMTRLYRRPTGSYHLNLFHAEPPVA